MQTSLPEPLPAFTSLWQMQGVTADALPAFTSLYGTQTSLAEALEYEVFAY